MVRVKTGLMIARIGNSSCIPDGDDSDHWQDDPCRAIPVVALIDDDGRSRGPSGRGQDSRCVQVRARFISVPDLPLPPQAVDAGLHDCQLNQHRVVEEGAAAGA